MTGVFLNFMVYLLTYVWRCADLRFGFFEFVIISLKAAFVEDQEFIFFSACHVKGCYGEDDLFPGEFGDFAQRQYQISVFFIHGKLVGSVCDRLLVKVQSAAEYSVMT